jgi:D-arabinose 1-dehydrogenase-like Zn-dependent alcohol dehydrogenase
LKAVEITEPSKLVFKDFPSRPLKEYEIRIKVACTCVCGSDLRNIKNPAIVPQIPGHEFSGEVMETSIVSQNNFRLGKKVTVFPIMGCLKCSACEEKNYRDCEKNNLLGFNFLDLLQKKLL